MSDQHPTATVEVPVEFDTLVNDLTDALNHYTIDAKDFDFWDRSVSVWHVCVRKGFRYLSSAECMGKCVIADTTGFIHHDVC